MVKGISEKGGEEELEKREKSTNKKAKGRRRRKGRRGSIHSNSVVKATACPTARRYLWGGFWVASVAADVTADRVPPPPRCPLFCSCSCFLLLSVLPLPYVDPFCRSDTVRDSFSSSFSSEEKSIFQAIPLGHTLSGWQVESALK